jgi:TM2 domain-containing membrane protein YozV
MHFIKKSYFVAYLLLFIGGCLGLHRFYLGRTGTGLLYFFTFGLFCMGWLFDLIYTAIMVKDYNFEVEKALNFVDNTNQK